MPIAIQGVAGSFHHEAAERLFGEQLTLVPCERFGDVFAAVSSGAAQRGVIAIENSLYGSIHETYDMLVRHDLAITGELTLPVHQQLISFADIALADITEVYSHPAALDQCRDWLAAHLPQADTIEYHDTAAAVEYIRDHHLSAAAIASARAAELYDMAIIAHDIEDEADNYTRFVVIEPELQQPATTDKASMILITSHQPGALHTALGVFAAHNANLTKLESRPIRGERFRYQFLIDVMADPTTVAAIEQDLRAHDCSLRILGYYHASSL